MLKNDNVDSLAKKRGWGFRSGGHELYVVGRRWTRNDIRTIGGPRIHLPGQQVSADGRKSSLI